MNNQYDSLFRLIVLLGGWPSDSLKPRLAKCQVIKPGKYQKVYYDLASQPRQSKALRKSPYR